MSEVIELEDISLGDLASRCHTTPVVVFSPSGMDPAGVNLEPFARTVPGPTPQRNLSRKSLRNRSIHRLGKLSVEQIVASMIDDMTVPNRGQDVGDGADGDGAGFQQQWGGQQFRYLESKSEIKKLTRCMEEKRQIKKLLEEYESRQTLLRPKSLVERSQWEFRKLCCSFGGKLPRLTQFQFIEGRLGMGVSLFFRFVRSAIFINLFLLALSILFLVLPQVARRREFQTAGENRTGILGSELRKPFKGSELILGNGWFEFTELYYGFYTGGSFYLLSTSYDMSIAFFLVVCFSFLIVLVTLCVTFSRSFKTSYYNTRFSGTAGPDAGILFCAWDFNIRTEKTAKLKSQRILLDLKTLYTELKKRRKLLRPIERLAASAGNFAVGAVVLATLVASPVGVFFACRSAGTNPDSLAFRLGIPVLLTVLNNVVPVFLSLMGRLEHFRSPKNVIYLVTVRSSVLQTSNLCVAVYYWLSKLACPYDGVVECKALPCWETFVGTQLYVLVVLDFLALVLDFAAQIFKRLLHRVLVKKTKPKILASFLKAREFDVGLALVCVVYNQSLMWLSIYFSPLLSIAVIIKLLATFYLKKLASFVGCYEPVKMWRLGHLGTFIRLIHLVTFLLCMSVFVGSVVYITPSDSCGPFQGYNRSYEIFDRLALADDLQTKDAFRNVARDVLGSVGFRIYLCIIFGTAVYYVKVLSDGRRGETKQLKTQIQLERSDRNFYLNLIKSSKKLLVGSADSKAQHRDVYAKKRSRIVDFVETSLTPVTPQQMNIKASTSQYSVTPTTAHLPLGNVSFISNDRFNIMFPDRKTHIPGDSAAHQQPSRGEPQQQKPSSHGGTEREIGADAAVNQESIDRLFDFKSYCGTFVDRGGEDDRDEVDLDLEPRRDIGAADHDNDDDDDESTIHMLRD